MHFPFVSRLQHVSARAFFDPKRFWGRMFVRDPSSRSLSGPAVTRRHPGVSPRREEYHPRPFSARDQDFDLPTDLEAATTAATAAPMLPQRDE